MNHILKQTLATTMAFMMLFTACATPKAGTDSNKAGTVDTESSKQVAALDSVSKDGFPISKEEITLKGLASKYELVTDWNEHKGLKHYEEKTNIKIEWDCVPDNSFDERRNLLFASKDLPDLVVRANLNPQQETSYAAAGQIISFDDIMEYAPNLTALMEEDPGIRKASTAADGHIYSLPSISEADGRIASSWMNTSFLNALNLEMPTTMEEFKQTLIEFKTRDANGNGTEDEFGISGSKKTVNDFLKPFYGSWGFGANSGLVDDYLDIDTEGNVRYIPLDKDAKDMISFFASLWQEGLIDKEIFSQDTNQVVAKMDDKRVGFVANGNNFLWMGDNKEDFAQNQPFQVGDQTPVWIDVNPKVRDTGTFVITSANKHPEATLRWGDFFLSEPGTAFCRLGIEDVSYTHDEATNAYTLLPDFSNNPDGLSVDEALSDYALFQGGRMIMRVTQNVDQSAAVLPEMIANKDILRPFLVADEKLLKHPRFTEDEVIDLATYGTDIQAYTNENLVQFLTGEQPMDNWENFIIALEKMNMDTYLTIYQAAYDRWNQQ